MTPKFELTESDSLGYYSTFDKLFPDYVPYLKDKEADRTIIVNFQFTDEDTQPNEAQLAAHDFFLEHSNQMLENLVKYLKQDEEYFMEFYGVYREISYENTNFKGEKYITTDKSGFPAVERIQDFINYFGISEINISNSQESGIAYIGFAGGCPWDGEHGFGASFYKHKLLHLGDWDYGYHPSWGSSENKDLLTKSFTNIHQLEPLDKRKKRIAKASELIQVKLTVGYDQIFDWLANHQMIYGYRNNAVDLNTEEKIVVLNEIKELAFRGNIIQKVPDSINLLENLTSLSLSSNDLDVLPPELFNLPKLIQLSIINNKIIEIPKEIGLLINLKFLNFHKNNLNSIPEEIGQLKNLQHLDLSSNQLSDLPKSISGLKSLEQLNLNKNLFKAIPINILSVENLNGLSLMYNNLTEIQESIYKLKELESLDLRYNKLTKFPETLINQWRSLKSIYLVGNQFSINALERILRFNNRKINSDIDKELSYTKDRLIRQLRDEKNKLEKEKREAKKQENFRRQENNNAQDLGKSEPILNEYIENKNENENENENDNIGKSKSSINNINFKVVLIVLIVFAVVIYLISLQENFVSNNELSTPGGKQLFNEKVEYTYHNFYEGLVLRKYTENNRNFIDVKFELGIMKLTFPYEKQRISEFIKIGDSIIKKRKSLVLVLKRKEFDTLFYYKFDKINGYEEYSKTNKFIIEEKLKRNTKIQL